MASLEKKETVERLRARASYMDKSTVHLKSKQDADSQFL
jgi:hypothetical protein